MWPGFCVLPREQLQLPLAETESWSSGCDPVVHLFCPNTCVSLMQQGSGSHCSSQTLPVPPTSNSKPLITLQSKRKHHLSSMRFACTSIPWQTEDRCSDLSVLIFLLPGELGQLFFLIFFTQPGSIRHRQSMIISNRPSAFNLILIEQPQCLSTVLPQGPSC